jgi:hypothetical protein
MKSHEKILMQKIARREKIKKKLKNKQLEEESDNIEGKMCFKILFEKNSHALCYLCTL